MANNSSVIRNCDVAAGGLEYIVLMVTMVILVMMVNMMMRMRMLRRSRMVSTFLVLPTLTVKEAVVENSAAREEATKVERRARRSILNNFNSCIQLGSGNGELSDHIKIRHSNIFCLTGKN